MRRTTFAILLAGSLLAAPALAAGPERSFPQELGRDFVAGAAYYVRTVDGWIMNLLSLVGFRKNTAMGGEGSDCGGDSICSPGLACLNTCDGQDCPRYAKRCRKGPERITVLGEFSPCGNQDLCAAGTDCTRVCQDGADCGNDAYRCLRPVVPTGSCQADQDCTAVCGQQPFPPFGPAAFEARCVQGACRCDPLAITPAAPRVACPGNLGGPELSCPTGSQVACTPAASCSGGACPPVKTCLTAPAFGGTCLEDRECAGSVCVAGAEAFCGDDHLCKCRVTRNETVSCRTPADCSGSACGSDETPACIKGSCACAKAVTSACKTVQDCSSDCPQGYAPACDAGTCACQRTVVAPIGCKTAADCGSISCPSGYDKACRDAVCGCARRTGS